MSVLDDEALTDPDDTTPDDDTTATEDAPRPALSGRGRNFTRPWRSGFCGVGNHTYCPGSITNGSRAGGNTIACACTCHQ